MHAMLGLLLLIGDAFREPVSSGLGQRIAGKPAPGIHNNEESLADTDLLR